MGLFTAIAIIVVVLVIIIIIVVIIVVSVNQGQNTSPNNTCINQNDCPPGYVCAPNPNTNTNSCKAGLGTPCNTDSDCVPDLICLANSSGIRVCTLRQTNSILPQSRVTWREEPISIHT